VKVLAEASKTTPEITWNQLDGIMTIKGYSYPENVKKVYDPIEKFIKELVPYTHSLTLDLELYHCSSSSVLSIYRIITALGDHTVDGTSLIINWRYEDGDEDLESIGKEFEKLSELPINFIKISD
jgi:hypothetical protein